MHASSVLLLAAAAAAAPAAAPAATTTGTLFIDNHCSFPVYLNTKSGNQPASGVYTLRPGTNNAYNVAVNNAFGAQHAITISRTPDLANPLQNVYSFANNLFYYSLSTIYGDPFKAQGFGLYSQTNGFNIVCHSRTAGDCPNTYSPSNRNGNNAVFAMQPGNLVMSLCSDKST